MDVPDRRGLVLPLNPLHISSSSDYKLAVQASRRMLSVSGEKAHVIMRAIDRIMLWLQPLRVLGGISSGFAWR
jgi:hypothetical protein